MAAPYDGQDPIVPNAYIAGKGFWIVPNVAEDSEDRDAANFGIGVEGVIDRTNWLAWRMVNGLEGGTYGGDIVWNGTQTFNDTVTVNGDATFKGTSTFDDEVQFNSLVEMQANVNFYSLVQFGDPVVFTETTQHLGLNAYRVLRKTTVADGAGVVLQPWKYDFIIASVLTANRSWSLDVPPGNACVEVTIWLSSTVGGFQLTLQTTGSVGTIATLGAGNKLSVVLVFNGTDWVVKSSNSA